MNRNMGTIDRVVRVVFALVVAVLLLTGLIRITSALGIVLGVLAVIFLVTGAISFCPLYLPFRLSTRKET